MIDDFEDGDLSLPASAAGRVGSWYAYGDGSGSGGLETFALNRGASVHGLHGMGKNFTSWGSGFGVDFHNANAGQSTKAPYDASSYTGITFWARAESKMTVTVTLPDADTDAAGNTCTTCGHHYSKAVQLTTDWQRFTIAFSELLLEQGTVPAPSAFKASGVVSVQWTVAAGTSYDLYLDDVAFVK
jgi:hypothetical protein